MTGRKKTNLDLGNLHFYVNDTNTDVWVKWLWKKPFLLMILISGISAVLMYFSEWNELKYYNIGKSADVLVLALNPNKLAYNKLQYQ